jgi:hypothetical protein
MKNEEEYFNKLLSILKPYNIKDLEVFRCGRNRDGGYVIPVILPKLTNKLVSVGISNDISFEEHFCKENKSIEVFCFDHTINNLPEDIDKKNIKYHFFKKGLGLNKPNLVSIQKAFKLCEIKQDDKIFLKMDAEGAEWKCGFKNFDFKNVLGIVLELHTLNEIQKAKNYFDCLKNINDKFLCIHVHGNNCEELFDYKNKKIPRVIEVTFINKELVKDNKFKIWNFSSPTKIDQRNCLREELHFRYW